MYWSSRTAYWSEPNFCWWGFLGDSDGKESACNTGDVDLIPGSGRLPWRREWFPTPVFLLGEFHRQRSLVDYSPRTRRVRHDWLTLSLFTFKLLLCMHTHSSWTTKLGTSLAVQWLRICLPMQGTWVQFLAWKDPTCCGATKPVRYKYWAGV